MIVARIKSLARHALLAGSVAGLAALIALPDGAAFARGGGSNITNAPGYLRALEESRKQRRLATQPYVVAPVKRTHRRSLRRR